MKVTKIDAGKRRERRVEPHRISCKCRTCEQAAYPVGAA